MEELEELRNDIKNGNISSVTALSKINEYLSVLDECKTSLHTLINKEASSYSNTSTKNNYLKEPVYKFWLNKNQKY